MHTRFDLTSRHAFLHLQNISYCCCWQVPPSIAVTSPLQHSSVSAAGHLLTPGLELWNPQESVLADVVQEVCNTLSGLPSAVTILPLSFSHSSFFWSSKAECALGRQCAKVVACMCVCRVSSIGTSARWLRTLWPQCNSDGACWRSELG